MRLLFVVPEYVGHAGGGIVTFYRSYLPALAAAGHEVRVIVGSGVTTGERAERVVDGVRVETLDTGLFNRYVPRFARYGALPQLRNALAAAWAIREQAGGGEGCDLVEASDWGLLFLPWVIEAGPPCVVQLHGSMGQIDEHDPIAGEEVTGTLLRMMERAGVARATVVQATSRMNAAFWSRETGRDVQSLLPAWCSVEPIPATQLRSESGIVVGRIQRWKGPEVLCDALRLLGNRAPKVNWVGRDTPWADRATSSSAHLSAAYPDVWGHIVVPQAQVAASETARLQTEARFALVPSLWDVFNFSCVESMSARTLTVCSTGAGASELIQDGVNGFTFEANRAESLASALDRLLSLGEREAAEMADAGRTTVLERLNPQAVTGQRIEAYAAIIGKKPVALLAESDWLRQACAPGEAGGESLAFLDHLALQPLAAYALRRLAKKLGF